MEHLALGFATGAATDTVADVVALEMATSERGIPHHRSSGSQECDNEGNDEWSYRWSLPIERDRLAIPFEPS